MVHPYHRPVCLYIASWGLCILYTCERSPGRIVSSSIPSPISLFVPMLLDDAARKFTTLAQMRDGLTNRIAVRRVVVTRIMDMLTFAGEISNLRYGVAGCSCGVRRLSQRSGGGGLSSKNKLRTVIV